MMILRDRKDEFCSCVEEIKIQLEFLLEILSSKSYEYFIYSKQFPRYGGVKK